MIFINKIPNTLFTFLILISILVSFRSNAEFFKDISHILPDQEPRLSYGIGVTDFNQDSQYEFIVTGFKYPNLALSYKEGKLENVIKDNLFSDSTSSTIGVAACDVDRDGNEELYFLNTDTYSGRKKYSDRLLKNSSGKITDIFEDNVDPNDLNLTAGRSVVCVDRLGRGKYATYVANYGGPTRFYEFADDKIRDIAPSLGIDRITGGRAVIAGHILTKNMDIFAANERDSNFLYLNDNGKFKNVAKKYNIEDRFENGRGTTLSDVLYRGRLDIITGNWESNHRIFALDEDKFEDISQEPFNIRSRVRTIISADFDNDGYDEIFINNIGQPNRLYKIMENGILKRINFTTGRLQNGYGTGAAVADIDNDGILELLIAHGERKEQPLKIYKANINNKNKYLRIKPLNQFGAPARGATVTLKSNLRTHSKTIDAGSGYLCQMEPVAHFGIRRGEKNISVSIRWTNGSEVHINNVDANKVYTIKQILN